MFEHYAAGAALATDLVNSGPPMHAAEELADAAGLRRLLAGHADVPGLEGVRPAARDLAAVRALREQLRAVVAMTDEAAAVAALDGLIAEAAPRPVLVDGPRGWTWTLHPPPDAPVAQRLAVVSAASLLEVVRTLGIARFRPCAASFCHGRFVDTSRAGTRRYCMPEICGNRVHVANHRARRRPSS